MGSALALRLLAAGCDLAVYNRTKAKAEALAARGASIADTAAGLGAADKPGAGRYAGKDAGA